MLGSPRARADSLILSEKKTFEHVTVTGLNRGRITFMGISGETIRIAPQRVAQITLDDVPAFSQAESLRQTGKFDQSWRLYQRCLADSQPGPHRDLFAVRYADALQLGGRFDEAVRLWLDWLDENPTLAASAPPRHPATPGSAVNRAAADLLRRGLSSRPTNDETGAAGTIRRAWLELCLFDEVSPLPVELRHAPATDSQPLLFSRPSSAAALIVLERDSYVLEAASAALEERDFNRALALLDGAVPFCDSETAARLRLPLGQARLELGQVANALNDLLTAAELPDASTAARALYYVGQTQQRLGNAASAKRYYRAALEKGALPTELEASARTELRD